jgi:hypothetical protein
MWSQTKAVAWQSTSKSRFVISNFTGKALGQRPNATRQRCVLPGIDPLASVPAAL